MPSTSPRWVIATYRLEAGDEARFQAALSACDYHDFTIVDRSDGARDLTCYGRGGKLPPAIEPLLAPLQQLAWEHCDEADLLARYDDKRMVELCPGVWVIPAASSEQPPDNGIPLRLAAGPAFGDGRHPTTRAAARLMAKIDWSAARVWDVGAGSGILGILAAAWGAQNIAFSDIDHDAVRTCQASCAANGLEQATVLQGDLLAPFPCPPQPQVIIANIYAELLHLLLDDPKLQAALGQGQLILSGISHQKIAAVRAHLARQGFTILHEDVEEWWHALHAQRGAASAASTIVASDDENPPL
ncbi:MAG: methyltransferase domain-containing protein [Planctomycetota bacterium]|nr:MAG: methyltransferase domain-containing protein [Planctomycetota bacterium]